jgi:hypothetical protein
LPTLDFADMTYSGVLATLLSGLEPSVAIALACLPQMRPLFARKKPAPYGYGSREVNTRSDGESAIRLRSVDGVHEIRVKKSWDVVSDKQEAREEGTRESSTQGSDV